MYECSVVLLRLIMPWGSFFSKIKRNFSSKQERVEDPALAKKAVHFPYDFDRWYARLKDFSFDSQIIAISPRIAQAMVHFYQRKFQGKDVLTHDEIELLQKLEVNIQHYLDSKDSSDGVFVRMSNRSPKDGMPFLPNGQTMLSQYQSLLKNSADTSPNDKMIQLSDMQMKWLQCNTAQQVMSLLLTSERVYADLHLALDCHHNNKKDKWSTSIILRDWQPALRQDMEFRVFVSNNKITAISQYNHYCKYPSLTGENAPNLESIYQRLMAFAVSVHPVVKEKNYVLDLAIINNKVFIIELNPLDETTGACLFSWKNDRDLLSGKQGGPATIRVREEPLGHLDVIIDTLVSEQASVGEHDQEPYYTLLEQHPPSPRGPN